MSKKAKNNGLRLLMGACSVLGFVGGWVILGQSGNTYSVNTTENAIVSTVDMSNRTNANPLVQPTAAEQATAVPTTTIVQISPTTASNTNSTTQTTTTTTRTTAQNTRLRSGGS